MAGYYNYSMSNNAVTAYENNIKPLSAWSKYDILEEIEEYYEKNNINNIDIELFKKLNLKKLKSLALTYSEYHHTGKLYKVTDFYTVDYWTLNNLTNDKLIELINEKEEKKKIEEYKARCIYLEWSGTRAHPKATEKEAIGTIRGNWFLLDDGRKKSINARGFKVLEKIK